MTSIARAIAALTLLAALLAAGCQRAPAPVVEPTPTEPTQAVEQLIRDLRRNDLVSYSRHAVPPALHARLDTAWTEGRTRWPLTDLPLDDRLPAFIDALSAPGAEKQLLSVYRRQFSGANAELRSAAATLGLFATQYLRAEGDYSDDERAHYVQLVNAISRWAQKAPLGDLQRARQTIPQLVAGARHTGLAGGPERFRELGMRHSLERMGPFFERMKRVLKVYGLDVDADLATARATLIERNGDRARVRLAYTLAGKAIEAELAVERRDGHWYLSDALRHAEAEAARPPAGTAPAPKAAKKAPVARAQTAAEAPAAAAAP
ncbi:hypothetical protein [Lysobacter arvi]|uniref:Uncharacterized protein n=1 Tax=Lysobacter arvi TaxID=3038776 RepID=A0ABU1CHZ4_9GAMM|nr:hypothetical protein [Lysobacter arvi]MDR0184553.1 hypothetical protein [Lysobacter arvi]